MKVVDVILLIIGPAIVAFTLYIYRVELNSLWKGHVYDMLDESDDLSFQEGIVFIGIMSARNNSVQRLSIRQTWMPAKERSSLARVKFILGRSTCDIPPDYRISEYSCDQWHIPVDMDNSEYYAVSETKRSPRLKYNFAIPKLHFVCLHSVVISRLGVHIGSIGSKTQVSLIHVPTYRTIVSVTFTKHSKGLLRNGFYYKNVEPYLLPKDFEGFISVEQLSTLDKQIVSSDMITSTVEKQDAVIHFFEFIEDFADSSFYSDPRMSDSNLLIIPSFIYNVTDMDRLRILKEKENVEFSKWKYKIFNEEKMISNEMVEHQDIVQVDVMDTYKNLPNKLMLMFHHAEKLSKAKAVMKVDDDCYVNVSSIVEIVQQEKSMEMKWIGRFRNNWEVNRHGKWRETKYKSNIYPKFACGSGYILGRSLTSWLVNNSANLTRFQGEDVSLGIWLSVVDVNYVDESKIQCEKDCLSNMIVMPQLSPEEIRLLYTQQVQCSDPCGC